MNYDSILAIFNCFKDKIKYISIKNSNLEREIPNDVKLWYKDFKQDNSNDTIIYKKLEANNNLSIYYHSPRNITNRIITNSSEKEKKLKNIIDQERENLVKETIYNYLSIVLNNINIPPFNAKNTSDKSIYECIAIGKNSEQIKIDYDEEKLTTSIIIKTENKNLKIVTLPKIISTRYEGIITLPINKEESKSIFKIFQKRTKIKTNSEFVSITKDEINQECRAYGTIYNKEGIYIFNGYDNYFTIYYFEKSIINTINSSKNNQKLNKFLNILQKKEDLAATNFIEELENYGFLPNEKISIPCTSKKLQEITNKAFLNTKNLIKDLNIK